MEAPSDGQKREFCCPPLGRSRVRQWGVFCPPMGRMACPPLTVYPFRRLALRRDFTVVIKSFTEGPSNNQMEDANTYRGGERSVTDLRATRCRTLVNAGGGTRDPGSAGPAGGRVLQKPPDARPRPCQLRAIAEQVEVPIGGHHHALQLKRELGGVDVGPELAESLGVASRPLQRLQPLPLRVGDPVSDRSWTGVELRHGGGEETAAREDASLDVGDEALAKLLEPSYP